MLFDFKRLIICILFFSVFALKIIIERVFLFGRHVFVSLSIIRYDNNKNKKQLILHQKFETNITTHNIVIYFFFFWYIMLRVITCTRACIVEIICIL